MTRSHVALALVLVSTQGCHLTYATFDYGEDAGVDDAGPRLDADAMDAGRDAGVDAGCTDMCMGVCTDLSIDPERCGSCDRACSAPDNGTATCTDAVCGFECDPGYARVLGTCVERDAPRPIAPLSTSTVTSRRPTLRWELSARSDGARIELCEDPACTSVLQTIDAPGTSARPPADLPAGVIFWRMFARSSGVASPTPSVTWQLHVGARSADGDADTSWGTVLDVNGDGFADLVVGAPEANTGDGRAYVYHGSASGLSAAIATTLVAPASAEGGFGTSVGSAGDVNGDGFADLVVGAYGAGSNRGRAYVYLGSDSGLSATVATTLVGPGGAEGGFGSSVAGVGDANGDGFADVAVGAPELGSGDGGAYVYLGGADGLSETATTRLAEPDGAHLGRSVASAGDVNGDGFADLVVGAVGLRFNTGRTYVYLGGASGLSATAATVLLGPDGVDGYFGRSVASAGDVNGDGFADVVVGAFRVNSGEGRAYVYLGGVGGLSTSVATTLVGPDGVSSFFGRSVASAGDLNGDGFADLVVGADFVNSREGRAYVYLSGPRGTSETPMTTLVGPDGTEGRFGFSVTSAGDVNGDGFADLAVGASGVDTNEGRAYVYLGEVATTVATTLSGPDGTGSDFGYSIGGG